MERLLIYPTLKKTATSKKDGTCPLHVSVLLDNKRIAFPSLKRRIHPDDWDDKARQVRATHPNAKLINAQIKRFISQLDGDMIRKDLLDIRINKVVVREHLRHGDLSKDFLKYCRLKANGYVTDTARVYKSECNKIEKYVRSKGVAFRDLDDNWFRRYEEYMRVKLKNKHNTVWKSFKFLHSMLELAIKDKIIAESPLNTYDTPKYQQEIPEYLEWDEVLKVRHEVKTNPALSEPAKLAGWYFILSCMSGLRFSDTIKFTPERYVVYERTGPRLLLNMTKTGEWVSIAFTDDLAEAVQNIADRPIKITNQDYNRKLQILAAAAKVKPITSHMGRHSFAMRCAEIGMSIDEVQRLLGHRKREHTEVYFRIRDKRLDESLKEKWNK